MVKDKGISITRYGYRAQIRIHGVNHRRHFPKTTPLVTIRQWLVTQELKYRGTTSRTLGAFDADARRYLAMVKAMPTYAQRAQHIDEWIAAFGSTPRDEITAADIQQQLTTWRTTERRVPQRTKAGALPRFKTLPCLSAAAVNKRRTALMHLYRTLDGKAAPNPVRDVPKFSTPDEQPRAIAYPVIKAIFEAMPDSKSKARLMVIAYTGLPPAIIMTIQPTDVGRTWVAIQGRKKGRGTRGRVVPLTVAGVRAFKMMAREDAWGPFSSSTLRRAFKRACKAAIGRTDLVPYDLRHSFGTEVYRTSGDIRATQELMMHSTPQLTHRYTLAAVDERLSAALKGFGRTRSESTTSSTTSRRKA